MTLKYLLEKEFKQFFRHKFMPKLVVLFPLMIMVLMPWATTLDIKDINTIVVDHDASTMSSDLVKAVNASSYFRLRDVTESYEQPLRRSFPGSKCSSKTCTTLCWTTSTRWFPA